MYFFGNLFVFISGTNRFFRRVIAQFGVETSFVDCTDLNKLEAAIQPNTKVNFVSNDTCRATYN